MFMKKIITLVVIPCLLFIGGCEKDTTLIIKDVPVIVSKTVSFSGDIAPIFSQSCSLSGCHGAGGHIPNLVADNAYTSLMSGGFIDITTPENSKLYQILTGKLTPVMPMGAPNNPSNINGLVLAWIKQGAKKN